MTDYITLQAGDIVRLKRSVSLVPLDTSMPDHVPAGIFGQIVGFQQAVDGAISVQVNFAEPYGFLQEFPLELDSLDLICRFSLN